MSGDCGRRGANPADEWLSTEQFAAELGVTAATVMDWIAEGKHIPYYQLGFGPETIRFRRSEIERLLAEHARARPGGPLMRTWTTVPDKASWGDGPWVHCKDVGALCEAPWPDDHCSR